MAALPKAQHEQFARFVAFGDTPTKAYEKAYPGSKGAAASANALLKNPKISERVSELRPAAVESTVRASGIDKASWLKDLRELFIQARVAEQFGAAIKAAEVIGKSLGYLEKSEDASEKPTKVDYGWVEQSREKSNTSHSQASEGSTIVDPDSRASVAPLAAGNRLH